MKSLNYRYATDPSKHFYIVKTTMKSFDDFGFSDELKQRILLVDLPGSDTTQNQFNKKDDKDRSVYDLDLIFKFYDNQIHIDENGAFTGEVVRILDYGINKFLILKCFERELVAKVTNDIAVEIGDTIYFSLDVDNIQVFDKAKNIRLV